MLQFKIWGQYDFFFLMEINNFIQQGCIKLIKNDSKYIYKVQDFESWTLYSSKESSKKVSWFPQKHEATFFNTDNNKKYFLSSKSAY